MDFVRTVYPHPLKVNGYAQCRGEELLRVPIIDRATLPSFPPAFFRVLDSSYHFTDSFIAQSVFDTNTVFNVNSPQTDLFMLLAACGFVISDAKTELPWASHFVFLETILRNDVHILAEILDDLPSPDQFTFCSDKLEAVCTSVKTNLQINLVLLFYTPAGFLVYTPPGVGWDYRTLRVGIIASPRDMFELSLGNFSIRIRTPSAEVISRVSQPPPRIFCKFRIISGQWQPFFSRDDLAAIPSDFSTSVTPIRDGNTIHYWSLAGAAATTIGLIGRFDDILKLLPDKDRASLTSVTVYCIPCLFCLNGVDTRYVILYIPGGFPPTHPQYRDVAQFAYTWMRRCCTLTLLVPTKTALATRSVDAHIQGVVSRLVEVETVFHGAGGTQLVTLKKRPSLNQKIGSEIVRQMVFDGVNDLMRWAQWIAPAHQLVFDQLAFAHEPSGGVKLDKATLMRRFFAKEVCAALDDLFYGRFGKRAPAELTEIQLNDQERQPNLPSLLRQAAELTNLAKTSSPRDHCAVCECLEDLSDEQTVRRRSTTPDANLCPSCLVQKLREAPKSDGSKTALDNATAKARETKAARDKFEKEWAKFVAAGDDHASPPHIACFVKWFVDYLGHYCLLGAWGSIRDGNWLKFRHFEGVQPNDIPQTDLRAAIDDLVGQPVDYGRKVCELAYFYPQVIDSEQIRAEFHAALLRFNTDRLENRRPVPYADFEKRCRQAIARDLPGPGHRKPGVAFAIKSVTAAPNLSLIIEPSDPAVVFVKYVFYATTVSTDEAFSAQQILGEKIATLVEQPESLQVANAWFVSTGALVLFSIGQRLRLVFLPVGFRGRSIDSFVYETEIANAAGCIACYAPLANLLYVVFNASGDFYMAMIELSLDFKSSTEIMRRPTKSLLPLPRADDEVRLDGFMVDSTASRGVVTATRRTIPTPEMPEELTESYIIDFDPALLTIVAGAPECGNVKNLWPLHFHKTEKDCDTVVAVSTQPDPDRGYAIYVAAPKKPELWFYPLTARSGHITNKIGVGEFFRKPILTIAQPTQAPVLQTHITAIPTFIVGEDMFNINFDIAAIPQFVAGCLARFGLSEIERVCFPSQTAYPVELVKFDVLHASAGSGSDPYDPFSAELAALVDTTRASFANVFAHDWDAPIRVHMLPQGKTFRDLLQTSPYRHPITLVARLAGLPQRLITTIPAPIRDLGNDYSEQIIPVLAHRLAVNFPPFSLLRATEKRKAIVISLVDIGNSEGSSLFSALTGVPFMPAMKGTFALGSNYVPVFKTGTSPLRKELDIETANIAEFRNILAVTVRPDRPAVAASNVVALYTAIASSDLVVVNAGDHTEFLTSVLNLLISSVATLDSTLGHLLPWAQESEGEHDQENDGETGGEAQVEQKGPKLAFVVNLGANTELSKRHLNGQISQFLSRANSNAANGCFTGDAVFVHSKASAFEIAHSIAQSLMLGLSGEASTEFPRNTWKALVDVERAAGFFGVLSAYLDEYWDVTPQDLV
jgi:hypothetical protein